MKITHVSMAPTQAATQAGRPALTPELLAATGARYSRSDEGLEAILAKINHNEPDKSVEQIFKFVDYGHQSIADMAPVALFIDGISLYLAYYLWTLCPTAGGQESSTRYIKMDESGLVDPDTLGISGELQEEWQGRMRDAFGAYHAALTHWENEVRLEPSLARIPETLRNDSSEKAQKAVKRMERNYAFDRARYFLPVAAKTNVMLVQPGRAWVTLVQHLLSSLSKEARLLGHLIKPELALCIPHLMRHATQQESLVKGMEEEFRAAQWHMMSHSTLQDEPSVRSDHPAIPRLEVYTPTNGFNRVIAFDLAYHDTRYAYIGQTLKRTSVRFGWDAVAFAELRDLNRHRTGTKYALLFPMGFYGALDELPTKGLGFTAAYHDDLRRHVRIGHAASERALELLQKGDTTYIYHTLLGTQFPFEHTTTADKFIYEAELRTGTGAHYRYAQHFHGVLALWYERYPETRGRILEGSAEPE